MRFPNYLDWRDRIQTVDDIAASHLEPRPDQHERVEAMPGNAATRLTIASAVSAAGGERRSIHGAVTRCS